MEEKLNLLETQLGELSRNTKLTEMELSGLPDTYRKIHSHKIFGKDLLAIPSNYKAEDEFEKPFHFIDELEDLKLFESEYRADIPEKFMQLGCLYGSTEIILLDTLKATVHKFHISDIADTEWLKYKLEKPICSLKQFIGNIRPQTVCCFINPNNYSQWDIFEMRDRNRIKTEDELFKYGSYEESWAAYVELARKSIDKGYKIHYAPKRLRAELGI